MPGNFYRQEAWAGLATAALMLASPAQAAPTGPASAVGQVQAEIVLPLKTVAIDDLEFGTVSVSGTSGGSVEIPAAGGPASYAGAAGMACPGTACVTHPASFVVSGEPGRRYQVTLPSAVVATGSGGSGVQLKVGGIRLHTASRGDGPSGFLDAQGQDNFRVGGTLEIPAATPPDRYRAEVTVLVAYN